MSRTYRRDAVQLDCNCGAPVGSHWRFFWRPGSITPNREIDIELRRSRSRGLPPDRACHCWTNRQYDFYSKRNYKRDHKSWRKCSKIWKKIYQKKRRARIRAAMSHKDYENIPKFRNENDWNWI